MTTPRFSRLDIFLLITSLLGAVLTSVFILREDLLLQKILRQQSGIVKIGQITQLRNDARRKSMKSLTWYPSFAADDLFENDSVFTGSDSELELSTNDNKLIRLNPNSLVVLQTIDNELVLNLQLGSVKIIRHSNQKIKIFDRGQMLIFNPSEPNQEFDISRGLDGEIKTESKIQIETKSIEPLAAVEDIQSPIKLDALTEPEAPVVETPVAQSQSESQDVTVAEAAVAESKNESQDTTVAEPVQAQQEKEEEKEIPVAKEVQPEVTEPKILPKEKPQEVFLLKTPQAISPLNGAIITNIELEESHPTLFAWTEVESAESYEIQFSNQSQFKKIILSEKLSQNRFLLNKKLDSNEIYWRVRAIGQKQKSKWTQPMSFSF